MLAVCGCVRSSRRRTASGRSGVGVGRGGEEDEEEELAVSELAVSLSGWLVALRNVKMSGEVEIG